MTRFDRYAFDLLGLGTDIKLPLLFVIGVGAIVCVVFCFDGVLGGSFLARELVSIL